MKIVTVGSFYRGKLIGGWEFYGSNGAAGISAPPDPKDVLYLAPDGRVLVRGVEIVPWTEARKKSMDGKGWVKP